MEEPAGEPEQRMWHQHATKILRNPRCCRSRLNGLNDQVAAYVDIAIQPLELSLSTETNTRAG